MLAASAENWALPAPSTILDEPNGNSVSTICNEQSSFCDRIRFSYSRRSVINIWRDTAQLTGKSHMDRRNICTSGMDSTVHKDSRRVCDLL